MVISSCAPAPHGLSALVLVHGAQVLGGELQGLQGLGGASARWMNRWGGEAVASKVTGGGDKGQPVDEHPNWSRGRRHWPQYDLGSRLGEASYLKWSTILRIWFENHMNHPRVPMGRCARLVPCCKERNRPWAHYVLNLPLPRLGSMTCAEGAFEKLSVVTVRSAFPNSNGTLPFCVIALRFDSRVVVLWMQSLLGSKFVHSLMPLRRLVLQLRACRSGSWSLKMPLLTHPSYRKRKSGLWFHSTPVFPDCHAGTSPKSTSRVHTVVHQDSWARAAGAPAIWLLVWNTG